MASEASMRVTDLILEPKAIPALPQLLKGVCCNNISCFVYLFSTSC